MSKLHNISVVSKNFIYDSTNKILINPHKNHGIFVAKQSKLAKNNPSSEIKTLKRLLLINFRGNTVKKVKKY